MGSRFSRLRQRMSRCAIWHWGGGRCRRGCRTLRRGSERFGNLGACPMRLLRNGRTPAGRGRLINRGRMRRVWVGRKGQRSVFWLGCYVRGYLGRVSRVGEDGGCWPRSRGSSRVGFRDGQARGCCWLALLDIGGRRRGSAGIGFQDYLRTSEGHWWRPCCRRGRQRIRRILIGGRCLSGRENRGGTCLFRHRSGGCWRRGRTRLLVGGKRDRLTFFDFRGKEQAECCFQQACKAAMQATGSGFGRMLLRRV
ncbi:hypothetical protein SAMN04488087_2521 [Rhodothermus profundi]|uniref:Uncharacterized protein n=1 Tax=Rhodothermus profundi TaxID=633813 RepID=A0A1M6X6G1_9BACT|nr:hypothetical protein SAMN04488087_2521 [Rhodothermus profundi]